MGGRQPYEVLKLHETYGPVVRTAPDELSFNTAQSWRDIYGIRKGHETFIKSEFYDGGNFAAEALSIVSERNPTRHSEMRKSLSSAFSDRSLREQEYLIAEVVDQFIDMLDSGGDGGIELDLVNAFNLTTFDIIGSLAFGESFGGVASGKEHFWVSIVVSSLRKGALADCFKRFPWFSATIQTLFSGFIKKLLEDTRRHEAYSMELVQRCGHARDEFMASSVLKAEQKNPAPD
ncbi:hypothetical protein N7G274_003391 [Stereocaulon virgatum]|uniref:Cytochrome P450 n=1 Tax=Stereocaulon virgatum TaxID=373712 RepID=A0ABR4AEG4_9LECA